LTPEKVLQDKETLSLFIHIHYAVYRFLRRNGLVIQCPIMRLCAGRNWNGSTSALPNFRSQFVFHGMQRRNHLFVILTAVYMLLHISISSLYTI
jgi:hypothetical protein